MRLRRSGAEPPQRPRQPPPPPPQRGVLPPQRGLLPPRGLLPEGSNHMQGCVASCCFDDIAFDRTPTASLAADGGTIPVYGEGNPEAKEGGR